jgi:hypothetical protein
MININEFQREHAVVNRDFIPTIWRVLKSGWYVIGDVIIKFERVLQCARDSKQVTFLEIGGI